MAQSLLHPTSAILKHSLRTSPKSIFKTLGWPYDAYRSPHEWVWLFLFIIRDTLKEVCESPSYRHTLSMSFPLYMNYVWYNSLTEFLLRFKNSWATEPITHRKDLVLLIGHHFNQNLRQILFSSEIVRVKSLSYGRHRTKSLDFFA